MKFSIAFSVLALALGCTAAGDPMEDPFMFEPPPGEDCPRSEHICDGMCVPEQDNEPDQGCSEGCGDPCSAPEDATATCTAGGQCSFECGEGTRREGNGCSCTPVTCEEMAATCGMIDDGCGGAIECGTCGDGSSCVENTCGCAVDEAEPNDVQGAAHSLGEFPDRPETTRTFPGFGLSSATDTDWFIADVVDKTDGTNPRVTIDLVAPEGADYEIGAWYICEDSGPECTDAAENMLMDGDEAIANGCLSTTSGGMTSFGLRAQCDTINDSGQMLIRILTTGPVTACNPYELTINVD